MSRLLVVIILFLGTGMAMTQESATTPIRQNPNIDRPITNEGTTSPLMDALQKLVAVYGPIAYSNDRPNPYTRMEPWGEPPPGNDGEWAAVIGAEGGPDGILYILHRCHSNSCVGRSEPPLVMLDPRNGKKLGTFGEGLMAFPHGFHVDFEGNVDRETTQNALRDLEAVTTFLKVLGSYPIGRAGVS